MLVLLVIVAALLLLELAVAATLMFGFGMIGWLAGGTHRCSQCQYLYLTPWGHASSCSKYPHPIHAVSDHLHHHPAS
jgi:hypothetical protein